MKALRGVALKISISLFAEVILTLVGLDDLANYSEFVFERPIQAYLYQPQAV